MAGIFAEAVKPTGDWIKRAQAVNAGQILELRVTWDTPFMLAYVRTSIDENDDPHVVELYRESVAENEHVDSATGDWVKSQIYRTLIWREHQQDMELPLALPMFLRIGWDEMPSWSFAAGDVIHFLDVMPSFTATAVEIGIVPERTYFSMITGGAADA